jgi:hypothetical protein
VANTVNREEMAKSARQAISTLATREYLVPAFVKSATAGGAPMPRTDADLVAMVETGQMLYEIKKAHVQQYPELQNQLSGASPEYLNVREMAKRAYDAYLGKPEAAPVNQELYNAMASLKQATA